MSDATQLGFSEAELSTLGNYLKSAIEGFGRLQSAAKFSDGQSNPTFLLTTDNGQYVLRRQPPGKLLKSAHAVDREYRVLAALTDTGFPVSRPFHLCEDRDVIGSMFYVMSYADGRIFWDPSLPDRTVAERESLYAEMSRILARLHDADVESIGLIDYGRPGNYFERQINRWSKQYRASETEKNPAMEELMEWLPDNAPADDGAVSLIHGDYRIDNLVFAHNEPRCIAVLDWELSTLGHPLADLAYQCMQLRIANDAEVLAGLGGVDRDSLGIPSEQAYVEMYCNARGIDSIPNWNFYLVFSFFRFAAILQGVLKRAIDGNASSSKAFQYGAMVPVFASMAMDILDQKPGEI